MLKWNILNVKKYWLKCLRISSSSSLLELIILRNLFLPCVQPQSVMLKDYRLSEELTKLYFHKEFEKRTNLKMSEWICSLVAKYVNIIIDDVPFGTLMDFKIETKWCGIILYKKSLCVFSIEFFHSKLEMNLLDLMTKICSRKYSI